MTTSPSASTTRPPVTDDEAPTSPAQEPQGQRRPPQGGRPRRPDDRRHVRRGRPRARLTARRRRGAATSTSSSRSWTASTSGPPSDTSASHTSATTSLRAIRDRRAAPRRARLLGRPDRPTRDPTSWPPAPARRGRPLRPGRPRPRGADRHRRAPSHRLPPPSFDLPGDCDRDTAAAAFRRSLDAARDRELAHGATLHGPPPGRPPDRDRRHARRPLRLQGTGPHLPSYP